MDVVVTKVIPAARNLSRQIVPPVLATLIAALLIAGFNRAFSGHLVPPRMSAIHDNTGEATRPIIYAANPREAVTVTEVIPFDEPTMPERIFAKDGAGEAGKDQSAIKFASAPAAAPTRVVTRKPELPVEPRQTEQRQAEPRQVEPRVAAVPLAAPAPAPTAAAPAPVVTAPPVAVQPIAPPVVAQPIGPIAQQPLAPIAQQPLAAPMPPAAAPLSPVAQEPPPVIVAKPMVTVPDRPRPAYAGQNYPNQPYPAQTYPGQSYPSQPYPTAQAYPGQAYPGQAYPGYDPRQAGQQQAQADQDAAAPRERRPLERFVDEMRPSSIFNHIREFGDRVEAAGNAILPNIRQ
jgi:hypothetical protein